MHLTPNLIILLILSVMTAIIWAPYLWPVIGFHLRRSSGPWLANFDRRQFLSVLLRDITYTAGLWSIFFARLWYATLYFWIALIFGVCCLIITAWLADRLERHGEESTAILLLSSARLTRRQLADFLRDLGALIPGKQQPYIGRLTYPNGYLWVRLVSDQLDAYDPASYTGSDQIKLVEHFDRITHLLTEPPVTMIAVTMTKTARREGEQATAHLVPAFAQRWPCIVEIGGGDLITVPDIITARDQHRPVFPIHQE
jgi:hypothetical protein